MIKQTFHLLLDGLPIRGAKHASGVNAVLLSELTGTLGDPALVEDALDALQDVLGMRRRRIICLLLATHYHGYDFTELNWKRICSFLYIVDIGLPLVCNFF